MRVRSRWFEQRNHHAASNLSEGRCAARTASVPGAMPEIREEQTRADPRRLKNHRQTAARMRAATDKVNAVHILEAIMRPQVQHLIEGVREIEGRALVDLVFRVPIVRRDDALEANPPLDIFEPSLRDLLQHERAETLALA